MSLWQQNYDPAGNIWLSSLIASLPILFFFFALIKLKLKGYLAATYTVAIALLVALFFYKMPIDRALASVVYGFFYGLWPIAWIIIAAVFVYKISVKTGQFDIIRSSILHHAGPAPADADCRLLLRGVSGRGGRVWRRWQSPPRYWWGWALTRSMPPVFA